MSSDSVLPENTSWSLRTFLALAACAGIAGGLLEAASRLWLQASGGTSFDMRLTTLSVRIAWVAPVVYAGVFVLVAPVFCVVQRLGWGRAARQGALVSLLTLTFLSAIAASGRLAQISVVLLSAGLAAAVLRTLPREPVRQAAVIRRTLPWLTALLVAVGALAEAAQPWAEARQLAGVPGPAPGSPHVVLIVLDTVRADHLSSYGYERDTSPVLTRLAREGVQFDRAVATSSWTLPTHVSMLTGTLPAQHGAVIDRFDNRLPTLATALRERGYRTGAVSANTGVFSRAQGFGEGFISFDDSFYSLRDGFFRTYYALQVHKRILRPYFGWRRHTARRWADNVTEAALAWIDEDHRRPFFLMLNYFDTHDPYVPPQPWRSRFSRKAAPGGRISSEDADMLLAPEEMQDEIDAYDGGLAHADHQIGRLLAHLDGAGLRDNTVVIVTADHGESLGQHGFGGHGTSLYMDQVHVPLILRYPGRIPPGLRVDTPVSHTNLAATLLAFAGGRGTISLPGQSLARFWTSSSPGDQPGAVSELERLPWRNAEPPCGPIRSVVSDHYHLIEHARCAPELYDLERDPAEARDLAKMAEYRPLVDRLLAELRMRAAAERHARRDS